MAYWANLLTTFVLYGYRKDMYAPTYITGGKSRRIFVERCEINLKIYIYIPQAKLNTIEVIKIYAVFLSSN